MLALIAATAALVFTSLPERAEPPTVDPNLFIGPVPPPAPQGLVAKQRRTNAVQAAKDKVALARGRGDVDSIRTTAKRELVRARRALRRSRQKPKGMSGSSKKLKSIFERVKK